MIKYFCKNCHNHIKVAKCPHCNSRKDVIISSKNIYWCEHCNVPLYEPVCSLCNSEGKELSSDLRPVFPEERLLIEIMSGEKPLAYKRHSIWASSNAYYVDGKRILFKLSNAVVTDPDTIRNKLNEYKSINDYEEFNANIRAFVEANKSRYQYIVTEATDYIREQAGLDAEGNLKKYKAHEMYVSFSGGKDSTVVSDLVIRALPQYNTLHLYGDTTLEFPETLKYANRFKASHKKIPFLTAKNRLSGMSIRRAGRY